MTKKHEPGKHPKVSVGEVVEKSEDFLTRNQKPILIGIGVIILAVVAFFGYRYLYKEPRNQEALAQMYMAELQFQQDSFNLALNGEPGSYYGFLQIIDEFGSTKAGNLSYYYAGISQLRLGHFEEAITLLKKYSSKDELVQAKAYCGIGDAYVEQGNYNDAVTYFMKAANYKDNEFTPSYLMKAAMVYEELGKYNEAIKLYERVTVDYATSLEASTAEKELVRAKILSQNS